MEIFDILIIGSGPAGLSAAIYAQRANLKSCLVERSAPGGKVITTASVENYPGFKNISGPELGYAMYDQAIKLGTKFIGGKVVKIKAQDKYKVAVLENNTEILAKTIIIATGMENQKLNIPGEQKFANHGVSYCAICDGMFFKNKPVAVVGSGNTACEESVYLSKICSEVYLLIRNDKMKAEAHIIDEVLAQKNIKILYNVEALEIKGDTSVQSFDLRDKIKNEIITINVNAVFPFIGFKVDPIIDELGIKKSANNFYIVDHNQKTSCDGIYAAGDIVDKKFRQISTAINDGTIAALDAKDYILKNF